MCTLQLPVQPMRLMLTPPLCNALHCIIMHNSAQYAMHFTLLQRHSTIIYSVALYANKLNYTVLHCSKLRCFILSCTTLLHCVGQAICPYQFFPLHFFVHNVNIRSLCVTSGYCYAKVISGIQRICHKLDTKKSF